jgi:hypothetical protein
VVGDRSCYNSSASSDLQIQKKNIRTHDNSVNGLIVADLPKTNVLERERGGGGRGRAGGR